MNNRSPIECVRFHDTGEPSNVLQFDHTRCPEPGRGEVLVRMLASPINPSDMMFIRGTYGTQPALPQIPGFEGVGIVEQSGGGLKGKLFTGKRVAVLNKAGGNWAEYTVVPESQVIPLSSKLSVEQAATFFVNPATAWIITQEVLAVPPGNWLLQTAAGSALGRMVIRLGRKLGFRTLNIVRRENYVSELKAEGATEVVVFDPEYEPIETLKQTVKAIVGNDGLRYAMDPVGGKTASSVAMSMSPHGQLVVFGTLSDEPMTLSPRTLMTQHSRVEGFWLGSFMDQKSLLFKLKLIRKITSLITDGTLATEIDRQFTLNDIHTAVQTAEQSRGKVLLKLTP